MDLRLDLTVAGELRSPTQIARRVTEDWAGRSLFCLSCSSDHLVAESPNTPVRDFACSTCGAHYQLKSSKRPFGRSVGNSAYSVKMEAIAAGRAPHYAFLQYSMDAAQVTQLFVVPGHFLSPACVERREPLAEGARRAGWVGSKILLWRLPAEARVSVIQDGVVRHPMEVRREWSRYRFLSGQPGGWAADVLHCVRALEQERSVKDFTIQDFYHRFEAELALRYPHNRNIRPKVRQQLQLLRDGKVLRFLGNGRYRIVG